MKKCTKCLEDKPRSEFYKDNRAKDGLRSHCKSCVQGRNKRHYLENKDKINERAKQYYLKNKSVLTERQAQRYQEDPDFYRKAVMKSRYKISLDEYDNILRDQNYGCMICGGTNESGRSLAVDHDHTCCPGKITCGECMRGLLCSNCNRALGLFKDDPELLKKAIAYLESYR